MADDDATARRTTKATTGKAAKKAAAKRPGVVTPPATKAVAKRAGARKAVPEAPVAEKRSPGKTVTRKASVRTEPVKKAAPAKKVAKKAAPAKKEAAGRDAGAILAPRKKQASRLRLAAEQTFDDDWVEPAPEPVRDDPSARVRAVLRAAAQSLEARDAPVSRTPPPSRAPAQTPPVPAPAGPEDAVTRVLVAPVPVEDDEDIEDEEVWESEDETDDGEWSPPEVLDDEVATAAPSTPPPSPPPPPPSPPPAATQVIDAPPPVVSPAPETKTKTKTEKPRRGLRRLLLALVVLAALAGVGFLAFSLLGDEGVDYSKLKVGDCFDSSPSNEVRGVKVEPCSEPHNSEIFFLVTHPAGPDDPYPGKDALVQYAADQCLGQPLTDYLGIPLEQSKLKDFEIVPQESAWEEGRRVLVCGLDTGGEGDITGSVKRTRR